MTTKTLGQVLYEAEVADCELYLTYKTWSALSEPQQREYERAAQAVAAVVREQCAQACEAAWHIDGSFTAQEFAAAIRSMK